MITLITTIICGIFAATAIYQYRQAGLTQKQVQGTVNQAAQIEIGWIDSEGTHGFRSGDTHSRLITVLPEEDCPAVGPLLEMLEEANGVVLCKKIKESMAKRRF